MRKTELAYIAGIIDGEGSIQINSLGRGKASRLVLSVGMCNPLVPYLLQRHFGGGVSVRPIGQCGWHKQTFWQWKVTANKALSCLEMVFPYLLEKKQQAELAICYQSSRMKRGQKASTMHKVIEEAQRVLMNDYHKGRI